ncbi:MAG: prolyl oligopeptidase family serine peptidase, partial [Bacteroidales bacterium]|nr:prolyl oligopeptidase family serine peptidase [Bacteroidales bacterium]
MKKLLQTLTVLLMISCTTNNPGEKTTSKDEKIIEKPVINWKGNRLTPEILWSYGRVGEVAVSPDKKMIVFGVKYYDITENKGNTDLYTMSTDGANLKQITRTAKSEFNLQWKPDGSKIGFLYSDGDKGIQLWEMNPDGTNRTKISGIDGGISGFKYAPDMSKVAYIKEIKTGKSVQDKHNDLPKANAYLAEDLMFRHWDSWVETYIHIFLADYDGTKLENHKDIMEDEPYDSPNRPFDGMEQITWHPNSKSLVYSSKKKTGTQFAISTNSDLYQYNIENGSTTNLTEGMMGYDKAPVFSPSGKLMAWESMERDGYEADKNRLFIMDTETGTKTDYTTGFDQNVHGLEWSEDGEKVYFTSEWHARFQVYELSVQTKEIKALTQGVHNYRSVQVADNGLVCTRQDMMNPTEIFLVGTDGKQEKISTVNDDVLAKLEQPTVEERWVKTTDGKDMLVWVVLPPNFDKSKKYPTLLYCQGGPQSAVSQFFSYRWNFNIMAANDYIIVAPNRRGLPSFGQEWNEQISGDWSGQNMKDYLSAIDELAKEPYVDETKLGAIGASYGGFSVFWLAGNHEGRFKA